MATDFPLEVADYPRAPVRPWGLLLETAEPLTGVSFRFPLGITFQGPNYDALFTNDVGCSASSLQAPHGYKSIEEQPSFSIYDSVICSTLSKTFEEVSAYVDARWPVLLSHAFALELLTGNVSGGHSLQDDDVALAASSTVIAAISLLEATLAQNLRGGQGMLHMPPSILVYGVNNGIVNLRAGKYYSPGGHLVVADSAYEASGTPGASATVYASGPVYWASSERLPLSAIAHENVDFAHNTVRAVEEAYGLLLFDPDLVWSTVTTKA